MVKIGLIAPEWSLDRILSIIEETNRASGNSDVEIVPFMFDKLSDISAILKQNKHAVNVWMLSGPLTFYYAKWQLKSEDDLVYLRITEAGLQKALLEATYYHGSLPERISLDFIEEAGNIDEMLEDVGISRENLFIRKYSVPFAEEDLVQFHKTLWENGQVSCAITTVPYVFDALHQMGIPVYSIKATKMEIVLQTELIIERVRSSYFKNAQLGLLIVELCLYKKIVEETGNPYKLQRLELKTQNTLLTYCQQISGYLVEKGNGRYEVFGSRGRIEENIARLKACLDEVSVDLNVPVAAGIGFGETVFLAQINADKAINHARRRNGIVILREDGTIVEPAGKPQELSYSAYSENQNLNDRLHEASVGIRIYQKMRAIVQMTGTQTFTAAQIAKEMGVTDRNVRRIISGLSKAKLIEVAGKETSGVSGRPSNIYRFTDGK